MIKDTKPEPLTKIKDKNPTPPTTSQDIKSIWTNHSIPEMKEINDLESIPISSSDNGVIDDINDNELLLDGDLAADDTMRDTSNCVCNGANNRLMISCDSRVSPNCKCFYHQNCDNVSANYFKKRGKPTPYWECSMCFKITCFGWASPAFTVKAKKKMYKLNIMCMLDQCLMMFYTHPKFNQDFMKQIPPELSQLQTSLELALIGKYELALLSWAKYLHNINALPIGKYVEFEKVTSIDTFGSVDEYFINQIIPLVHMYHTWTSSNTNCPMQEHITRIDALAKPKNEKIDLFICHKLHNRHKQCHQHLNKAKCSTLPTLHWPELVQQIPLMLPPIFLWNADFEEILELPIILTFSKKKFHLGSVIIHS